MKIVLASFMTVNPGIAAIKFSKYDFTTRTKKK